MFGLQDVEVYGIQMYFDPSWDLPLIQEILTTGHLSLVKFFAVKLVDIEIHQTLRIGIICFCLSVLCLCKLHQSYVVLLVFCQLIIFYHSHAYIIHVCEFSQRTIEILFNLIFIVIWVCTTLYKMVVGMTANNRPPPIQSYATICFQFSLFSKVWYL